MPNRSRAAMAASTSHGLLHDSVAAPKADLSISQTHRDKTKLLLPSKLPLECATGCSDLLDHLHLKQMGQLPTPPSAIYLATPRQPTMSFEPSAAIERAAFGRTIRIYMPRFRKVAKPRAWHWVAGQSCKFTPDLTPTGTAAVIWGHVCSVSSSEIDTVQRVRYRNGGVLVLYTVCPPSTRTQRLNIMPARCLGCMTSEA